MLASQRSLGARFQVLLTALAGQPVFWLVLIVAMFTWPILRSIHAERSLQRQRPVLGLVRDFTLLDQHGELGAAELRGRIWVASFTTIECEPACALSRRVLATMGQLRHRTRNLGDAIRLVTFMVGPDPTTTETMTALSAKHRANHGTWRFVSGPPARVTDVLRDFQVAEGLPQPRLALVDANMQVRGYYDLADEAALGILLRDISRLLAPEG
jgi:cytochrome oxidase Cu insertion factor (SCO1/SenC/PrrC family)